ncbi:ion channel [Alcanivorax limicola]|uniref:ion channel n=1 Tax=Alcanivorax limicola TaxID=2874102 RepID=UPI001CBF09F9|nr:ion channel [Alcanivorax limicola]
MLFWEAPEFIVVAVTAIAVGTVIVFHYEVINRINGWCRVRQRQTAHDIRHRPTVLVVMFALLFAHVAEIWLFGASYWLLLSMEGYGSINGYPEVDLLDAVYFSAATYTTVGWGDLAAAGHIRFLAGTEALVGFMMITWSASFSYLIMARTWGAD